ncbi:MAG: cation transporter [Candidatus Binatia bacterium]|nr:MAG: cation transporter [Candidatus Binatia bacterium]
MASMAEAMGSDGEAGSSRFESRIRIAAALLSVLVGSALLGAKYAAYRWTGSNAIFSDAMESIVNVVAALFALFGVHFAARPADRSHPYGHGKVEFLSAGFEGGLVAFAAVTIVYQGILGLLQGVELHEVDLGLAVTVGAGVVNAGLGFVLLHVGRRYDSLTLVADGQHVLSDFWTSAGVAGGLVLVRWTGWSWVDSLVAVLVGVHLGWTGFRLLREAAAGLLDEEDRELLSEILVALNECVTPGIIRIHNLRAIRSGRFLHVDAHLVVPEFWSVERAHEEADAFERRVKQRGRIQGEIVFHTDPCRRAYCARCDVPACPIRVEPFRGRPRMTLEEAVQPDLPVGWK